MRRIKFLHFSDMHLDMPFTSLGTEGRRSEIRRQDLITVFKRIIGLAADEGVDLILMGGDLYEHDYVKKSTISLINDCFRGISHIKVFIIPGNHDPYTSDSYYKNFKWNENVIILSRDNPVVRLKDEGICIFGAGFDGINGSGFSYEQFEALNPGEINILLTHATLDMNFNNKAYNPVNSCQLDSLQMDYIALGHFHKAFQTQGANGVVYNPGSPEPLGFDEPGEHGIFVGSISKPDYGGKSSLSVKFIKTNEKFYESLRLNIDNCCSDDEVRQKLAGLFTGMDAARGLFNVTLSGYLQAGFKPDSNNILREIYPEVFFLKLRDETLPDYDFESLSAEPGLRGLFIRKMLLRIEKEDSRIKKEILTRALYYGIEALDRGEVSI